MGVEVEWCPIFHRLLRPMYSVLGTLSNNDIDLGLFAHGLSYGCDGGGNNVASYANWDVHLRK